MPFRLVALVLTTSICAAQTPTAPAPQMQVSDVITVPQGSLVALKLITAIKTKSTHPGDPVRAVVAFPLAIGTRVAIPAGTYVEGSVSRVRAHTGSAASLQLRFTRLLFANGYAASLVATNAEAMLNDPRRASDGLADARGAAPYLGEAFARPGQTNPQPPPLPSMGPSPGAMAGIGIGAGVGILVLTLAINHHRASSADFILFDSGWQFQMALEEPLTLDAAEVSAAAAMARE